MTHCCGYECHSGDWAACACPEHRRSTLHPFGSEAPRPGDVERHMGVRRDGDVTVYGERARRESSE